MGTWIELLNEFNAIEPSRRVDWLGSALQGELVKIRELTDGLDVITYASGFLRRPNANNIHIEYQDINGWMAMVNGLECERGLFIILHTPGGVPSAVETLVSYIWSKFPEVVVAIPTYAMSAGTMLALSANRIVMGRQSQLGPIDAQLWVPSAGRHASAHAIVDQFYQAHHEVLKNTDAAHVWAPILNVFGPALLQEAENALEHGHNLVSGWLAERMLSHVDDPAQTGEEVAEFFLEAGRNEHSTRISREKAREEGVVIDDLEDNQDLQDAVLSAYHLLTINFDITTAAKVMSNHAGNTWVINSTSG